MLVSDLNQMVNAFDRYTECQRRVTGYGIDNVFKVPSQERLREIAHAAGTTVRRTKLVDGTTAFCTKYRGLNFYYVPPFQAITDTL